MSTILVLEDEPLVLRFIEDALERPGHRVIGVQTAEEAIRATEENEGHIDLLISDVILRNQTGPEVARRLFEINPKMACVFISGYPREQLENRHLLDTETLGAEAVVFLQKPFTAKELAAVCEWLLQPPVNQRAAAIALLGIRSAASRFRSLSLRIAKALGYVELAESRQRLGMHDEAERLKADAMRELAKATADLNSEKWTVAEHSALRSALKDLSQAIDSLPSNE